jgi:two-component sensor histidine kinase
LPDADLSPIRWNSTASEVVTLSGMAKKASTSFPREREQRLLDYQRITTALARIGAEALPRDRLLHHVTALVSSATRIKRVKIMRYRADRSDLFIEAGVGWKPGVVGEASLPIDRASAPGRCLQTGLPVIVEDLPNDPEFRYHAVLREHGIVAALNVPIMFDGAPWGVFEVDSEAPRSFDDVDVGFLQGAAQVLGLALHRLETEQRSSVAEAEHVRQAARAETLLKELQHRVRNNFQTIIGFLSLHRRHASTENKERFDAVMDRVHAIALAHDQLSLTEGGSEVEFCDYLHALCRNLDPANETVQIEVKATRATLPLDRAVPAGLIVAELCTNSLKYAFNDLGGIIRVEFSADSETGEGCITVEDDGKGMGSAREGGLGLTLIDNFALQLNGRVERDEVEKGTRTRVCFPLAS